MMRTPRHLDPHAASLVDIWRAGWGLRLHRTPVGVFYRLEKGLAFRGGRRLKWWWAPSTAAATQRAAREALENPIESAMVTPYNPVYSEAEWEDAA